MALIGPRFAEELAAAGLGGLPITWDANGVDLSDVRLQPQQKDAVLAVLAAHDPLLPASPTPTEVAQADYAANRLPDPAAIDAFIDGQLDGAASLAELRTALTVILKRLARVGLYLARATAVDRPD